MTLKTYIKDCVYSVAGFFAAVLPKNRAVVLMYHSVGNNRAFFTVSESEFARQMEYLKRHAYNVVSLVDFSHMFQNGNIPPKTVVLTFDDGYADNYLVALPILEKYHFPATVFLATGLVGGERTLRKSGVVLPAVSWEQARNATQRGMSIQPHTVQHHALPTLSEDNAEKEITLSKEDVEKNLGTSCSFFAYPCGDYTDAVLNMIKKHHFSLAFSVRPGRVGVGDNPFSLKRNSVDSKTTFTQFKNLLKIGKI